MDLHFPNTWKIIWKFPEIGVSQIILIFMGISLINHPFRGTPILGNLHMENYLGILGFVVGAISPQIEIYILCGTSI